MSGCTACGVCFPGQTLGSGGRCAGGCIPPQPHTADPRHPFAESLAFLRQEQGRRTLMLMGEDFHDCSAWQALDNTAKRVLVARALKVPPGAGFDYQMSVSRIDEYCAANAPEGSVVMASGAALFGRPQVPSPLVPGPQQARMPLSPAGQVAPMPRMPLGPSGQVAPMPRMPLGPSGLVNPGLAAAEAEGRARGGRALLLIGMDCLRWSRMPTDAKAEALRRGLRTPPSTQTDFDRAIKEADSYCDSMGFRAPIRPTGFAAAEYKNPARSGGSAVTGLFGRNAGVAMVPSGQIPANANTLAAKSHDLDVAMRDALARNDYATYERLWGQASRLTQAARLAKMDAFSRPGIGLSAPEDIRASGQLNVAPMMIPGGLSVSAWNVLTDVEKLTYVLNNAQTADALEAMRSIGLEQGYRGITEAINAANSAMGLGETAASGTAAGWESQARTLVHAAGQVTTPVVTPPAAETKMTVSPWLVAALGAAVIGGVVIYRQSTKDEGQRGPGGRSPHDNPSSPYYPVAR